MKKLLFLISFERIFYLGLFATSFSSVKLSFTLVKIDPLVGEILSFESRAMKEPQLGKPSDREFINKPSWLAADSIEPLSSNSS